jgi:UDP-N-acetylmuramoylalanine--D-glutamate ligase
LLVKNPGIPYSVEPIQRALEKGIDVVTEVEVAALDTQVPIIGITGSNGKTTTTTLVGLMLEAAQLHPLVCGNIGKPLCDAVAEVNAGLQVEGTEGIEGTDGTEGTNGTKSNHVQWFVTELSSFQLKGTQTFRPKIACLTNLYETHLDYHGDMQDYAESKWQLFARQQAEDIAILHAGHDITESWIARGVPGQLWLFSASASALRRAN